jgi:hypothetical protein
MNGAVGRQPQKFSDGKQNRHGSRTMSSTRRIIRVGGKKTGNCSVTTTGIYLDANVNAILKITSQSPRTAVQSSPANSAYSIGN